MGTKCNAVLCGIGGYGDVYLKDYFEGRCGDLDIIAGVDPMPQRSKNYDKIKERQIPVFDSLESFYEEKSADLVIIASPIQFHCPQMLLALENGSNVLCEKPMCATIQEAREMNAAAHRSGLVAVIGYQWAYTEEIQTLKTDILAGLYGAPTVFKTLVIWPRDLAYYQRNNWAGAIKDHQGRWVLDSPANNATAHYLQNMLYLAGASASQSTMPLWIEAELYRGHKIANYDTAMMRCATEDGPLMQFYTTHLGENMYGPVFELAFENGTVTFDGGDMVGEQADGTTKSYGHPAHGKNYTKVLKVIEAIQGKREVLCNIEAAMGHVLCMNGGYESSGDIVNFPSELIRPNEETGRVVCEGLEDTMHRCYSEDKLPSELGTSWAKMPRRFDLDGYEWYPGGTMPSD